MYQTMTVSTHLIVGTTTVSRSLKSRKSLLLLQPDDLARALIGLDTAANAIALKNARVELWPPICNLNATCFLPTLRHQALIVEIPQTSKSMASVTLEDII
jgi:hypothetical protein